MSTFITLKDALDALPLSPSSCYQLSSSGRASWLSRQRPGMPRGRHLWVNVEEAAAWFSARGHATVGAALKRIAAERYGWKEVAAR